MSYRDDLDAAHARSEKLERELSDAKRELSDLRGETALVKRTSHAIAIPSANKVSGELVFEAKLAGSLDQADLVEIAELVSDRMRSNVPEKTEVMPGSLLWTGARSNLRARLRVSSRRGEVVIRLQLDTAHLGAGAGVVGIFAGIGGALAGAAAAAAAGLVPPLGLFAFIPATWLSKRYLHKRWYRKHHKGCKELFDDTVELADSLIARREQEPAEPTEE